MGGELNTVDTWLEAVRAVDAIKRSLDSSDLVIWLQHHAWHQDGDVWHSEGFEVLVPREGTPDRPRRMHQALEVVQAWCRATQPERKQPAVD